MKNSTLKRFLSLVLALTMVMSYAAVPAAATGDDPATEPSETTHECSFETETARTEATCGAAGSVTKACSCGKTTTETIEATGNHTYGEYTVVTEATCGAVGVKTAVCSVCKDVKEEEIPATGEHTYENGVCSVCQQNKPCSLAEGCDAPAHAEECPEKPQATQQEEIPVVCDGTETCAATSHETTCECYDPCIVLGCTEDAHHADCPYGPCTKTEGCELVKDHEGDCTGVSIFEAFNDHNIKFGSHGFDTLAEAFTEVNAATGDVTVEIYDKVTLNSSLNGSYSSIKFVGKTDTAEIHLDVQGYIEAAGKTVAFENLKLSKSTGAFIANAGFMNVAFGIYTVNAVTYTNCTFVNGAYASSGTVNFQNCTFYRSHDKYGLWAYGNVNCIVNGGKFDDYRGIKMYAEDRAKTTQLTVSNVDFSKVSDKPAIVLTYGKSVTLSGNTYSSTGVFELDKDGSPDGTTVSADIADIACMNDNYADCGVLVDGKIYTTLAAAVNAIKPFSTVTMMYDSQETVALPYGVTLNKNNYACTNVTVSALDTAEEFRAALERAGNITLGGNITLAETLTIPAGKTVTIDLNGYSITNSALAFQVSGTLNLSGKGTENDIISGADGIKMMENGVLNINSGVTLTGKDCAIYSSADSTGNFTVNVNGGILKTTSAQYAAVQFNGGNTNVSMNVSGGTIEATDIAIYFACTGKLEIKNGTIEGATGVVAKNGTTTISGGTIKGTGAKMDYVANNNGQDSTGDALAVVNSGYGTVNVSVTGGTFTSTNADAVACYGTQIGNFITGGTFSSDVTDYLPIGYTQDSTGKVVEKNVTVQSTGTNVNVSATIPETDSEVSGNAATINNTVSVPTTDSKVQAAIAEIDGAAEATGVKVSLNLNITKYENTDSKITLTFDVAPHVQPVKTENGTTTNVGSGVTLKEVDNPITFRLPMPDGTEGKIASVTHVHSVGEPTTSNHVIQEENGKCFVEISSKKFSAFIVSITSEEAVALLVNEGIAYSNLAAANQNAGSAEVIRLLKDVTLTTSEVFSVNASASLDLNGKTLTGTVLGTIRMNNGTYYTYDATAPDGKYKMSAPTGSSYNTTNAIFKVEANAITIMAGDVVLGNDMETAENHTLTVAENASFTVPSGKKLYLKKEAIVNGTLTVNGEFILNPNAKLNVTNGQVTGTGAIELKTDATVTGPANLNVITKITNKKVSYNSVTKVYSITDDFAATVGGTGYYSLKEALEHAPNTTNKTVVLEKDCILSDDIVTTGITIDLNKYKIQGTGSITSDGTVTIKNVGNTLNATHTVLMETGDKVTFDANGGCTFTANPTNLYGYDSIKVTIVGTSSTSYYYFMRTSGDYKGNVLIKANGEIKTNGHVLSSLNSTPTYTVTAIKVNDKLGSSYTYGSTETITIESNGFHSCFSDVYVNGLKLATTAYEHKEGSTIITLKNSYLKTLSKGQYKVILTYADGNYSNEVSFYVVSAPKAAWNPQTGDMILPAVFVMIAAAAGLGVLVYLGKKKKK